MESEPIEQSRGKKAEELKGFTKGNRREIELEKLTYWQPMIKSLSLLLHSKQHYERSSYFGSLQMSQRKNLGNNKEIKVDLSTTNIQTITAYFHDTIQ